MKNKRSDLIFISFGPAKDNFRSFLPLEFALSDERELEKITKKATKIYEKSISRMHFIDSQIKKCRKQKHFIPARKIWQLGNEIFRLREALENIGLEIDGIYDHLTRDLNLKRKWLEKVIIFRRFIPNMNLIPNRATWGYFEKGTRKKAFLLTSGELIS